MLLLACAISVAVVAAMRWSSPILPLSAHADRLLVEKHAHTLTLFEGGRVLKVYRVALGRGGLGPKVHAGDNKVPEGMYLIAGRKQYSAFHRALRVGYPTSQQVRLAHEQGIDPGGDIMVHGIRNGLGWLGPLQRLVDWTKGCVAVTDSEIDEIWRAVPDGTPIEIRP